MMGFWIGLLLGGIVGILGFIAGTQEPCRCSDCTSDKHPRPM